MDNVEGFRKFNDSITTELFEFKPFKGKGIEVNFGPAGATVMFEERNRKAVADLFRKMADSLDGEDVKAPPAQYAYGFNIVQLLVNTGLCTSRGTARRIVDQGLAYLDNEQIPNEDFVPERGLRLIARGKHSSTMVEIV